MDRVESWMSNNVSSGSGDGDGSGDGSGCGRVDGRGSGRGSGDGRGSGYGSGFGRGCGCGSGDGSGRGDGSGSDYVSGDGSGYGYGSGWGDCDCDGSEIKSYNHKRVYRIDNIPTIIDHLKGSFARGFILNSDLTVNPCYIAKGSGYFAHGKTIKEAQDALQAKIFEEMDSKEAITEFIKTFKKNEYYAGTKFFEWHHYLTGSCLMGRESFVKNRGLDLDAAYTVEEFISICENDYGSKIIKQLKDRWEEKYPTTV